MEKEMSIKEVIEMTKKFGIIITGARGGAGISVFFVSPQEQRYPTVGDYYEEDGRWIFKIVDTHDWRYNLLILIHELVEFSLTKDRGISEEDITKFDIQFEKEREQGKHDWEDEPGMDRNAPYHKEHIQAETIERLFASLLGVDWALYEKEINDIDFGSTALQDYKDELANNEP